MKLSELIELLQEKIKSGVPAETLVVLNDEENGIHETKFLSHYVVGGSQVVMLE
jgi:hypothetical protein